MLTLYRRHRTNCKHTGRRYKSCFCPIWVQGTLRGERIRHSLDLTNWEAANRLTRDWEIEGKASSLSVRDACERFVSDCEHGRKLSEGMLKKYKHVTAELTVKLGDMPLRSVSVDELRRLREGWKLAPITMQKRLEMMRAFFKFCMDSGWIEKNPARPIRLPVFKMKPTMPFTDDEWKNILTAVDVLREIHPQIPEATQRKLKALILLMRYSGVRISDAVTVKRDRIKNGKLFLYAAKTGKPVYVPLPKNVLDILKAADDGNSHLFWSGIGKLKSALTEWQDRLKKVGNIAGVTGRGFAHRLRDTFSVSLLEKGVPLETVAALLGNTVKVCEKHYAPWIESRQLALEAAVRETWN